jgi:hypothetical protein
MCEVVDPYIALTQNKRPVTGNTLIVGALIRIINMTPNTIMCFSTGYQSL